MIIFEFLGFRALGACRGSPAKYVGAQSLGGVGFRIWDHRVSILVVGYKCAIQDQVIRLEL